MDKHPVCGNNIFAFGMADDGTLTPLKNMGKFLDEILLTLKREAKDDEEDEEEEKDEEEEDEEEEDEEEDEEEEDEREMCFNCEELTDRDKLRECECSGCDNLICSTPGSAPFCYKCEEDIAFKCAECDLSIVRNSNAHDYALTHDGITWWCEDCYDAFVKAYDPAKGSDCYNPPPTTPDPK